MRNFKLKLHIPMMIIGGIVLAIVLAFAFAFFVKILWNWLMPDIFHLTKITYWQAWGLVLLSHLLFKVGAHPFRGRHNYRRDHPDGWKEKLREKLHNKFNNSYGKDEEDNLNGKE